MKKLSFLLLFFFLVANGMAQSIPRGMKYQAVARDLKGEVLANANIDLRINLLSKKDGNEVTYYSEVHSVVTNQLGLFTLVVGEGKTELGDFDKVPWSTSDIWMEIQIRANGQSDFTAISNSQLLAVPYAYYAATAGAIVTAATAPTAQKGFANPRCPCEGGLSEMKVLYQDGPATPVTIKVYRKKDLTELITTFNGVNNGQILTVSAAGFSDGKLKENTYFQVGTNPVVEIPSECEEYKEPWEMSLGETFGNFSVLSHRDKKNNSECTVCDIRKEWHVGGNGLGDLCNLLGTKSYTDLIFITNNIERLRITKDGDINITNALEIGDDLTVKKNVYLNTVSGQTINYGPFTVNNINPTYLTGSLTVDKITTITDQTESTLTTNGALVVAGGVGIGKRLNVGGMTKVWNNTQSNLTTDGALVVTGGAGIGMNLNVGGTLGVTGATTLNGETTVNNYLSVNKSSDGFVAFINNSNTTTGDGLKIKLGKTHPAWDGSSYANITNVGAEMFQSPINTIRGWVIDHNAFSPDQLITLFPSSLIAGSACNLLNIVIEKLNSAIPLPVYIPATHLFGPVEIFGGIDLGALGSIPSLTIPSIDIPRFQLIPDIPTINCGGLPTFTVPNIEFTNVSNSLTNANQFISFVDKDNRELGSVRAQSVNDWSANYLDGTYFVNLMAGMVGIDLLNGIANAVAGFTNLSKSYNQIGVEYASGHADYAEWLERVNPGEIITAGDIVGVKGGKVSKNLADAEQILAVSHNPIVLGNAPTKEKEPYGNKVAFTGQVPVKVVGPVNMGDYIIAKGTILGYGVAVSPADITTADLKFAVGRSWETNLKDGPKMVNTLIGIDNGDYIKIMKDSQDKIQAMEMRMKTMEEKMDKILSGKGKNKTVK